MRKKKRAAERLLACAEYTRGDNITGGAHVCLEIGCGKGEFICTAAIKSPGADFIAVERIPDVAVAAVEKARSLDLRNVRFIIADAKKLADILPGGIISELYLNFSDPWPKRRHQNKRLTSPVFLGIYKQIMRPGAGIFLKTDNIDLFEYSLKTLPQHNFKITRETRDLYAGGAAPGENIQTEYEKKFVAQGAKICCLEAVFSPPAP